MLLYDLLLFVVFFKLETLISLLTKDYSKMKLCCELILVIPHVSTFFVLRNQDVSL